MRGEREKLLNILVILGLIAVVATAGAEGINLWSDPDGRWILGRLYALIALCVWTSAPAYDVQGDPDLTFAKWLGVFKKWIGMFILLGTILLNLLVMFGLLVLNAPVNGLLLAAAPICVTVFAGGMLGFRIDAYYPSSRIREFLAPKSN